LHERTSSSRYHELGDGMPLVLLVLLSDVAAVAAILGGLMFL